MCLNWKYHFLQLNANISLLSDGAQYLVTRASDTMETATHTKAITSSETAAAGGNSPKSRHSVASGGDTTSTGTGSTEVHMNSPTVSTDCVYKD